MNKNSKQLVIFASSIILFYGCVADPPTTDWTLVTCVEHPIDPTTFSTEIHAAKVDEFDIPILNYDQLPSTLWRLADPENNPNPKDLNGIELFQGKYYHPGRMASLMEWYLDSYFQTKDTIYLSWTKKYYDKVMEISKTFDNSLLFEFEFDWIYHEKPNECINILGAPWYSAMTQGTLLMDVTRLYEFTGDSTYLKQAKKIFNGYYLIRGKSDPWITVLDKENYLWLEEVPTNEESVHILNGFMYSIMGLYEYYRITLDEEALFLLKASLTTIKHNVLRFRNEGGISFYSLKYKETKEEYHSIHISLLKYLYHYSNDPFFLIVAEEFYNDYH